MKPLKGDPTGELDLPTLIERHERLVTLRRSVVVTALVLLTVLNLAVAGITARTLWLVGDVIEAGPARADRLLFSVDCRRQADLERFADAFDVRVELVGPRCAQLLEDRTPGQ